MTKYRSELSEAYRPWMSKLQHELEKTLLLPQYDKMEDITYEEVKMAFEGLKKWKRS
jgi:hypothetical protein